MQGSIPPRCPPASGAARALQAFLLPALVAAPFLPPRSVRAEVVRVEVEQREEVLGGRPFGGAGPYEKLTGRIYFAFDPGNPANAAIVDLSLAPVNADGRVEAWAEFMVLQPRDPDRRRGIAWLEVSYRGGKTSLEVFNRARPSPDPTVTEDFGDGLLLRHGLTLIWVGWQWNLPDDPRIVRLHAPMVRNPDGTSLVGAVRAEWLVEEAVATLDLAEPGMRAYLPADPEGSGHHLTVRSGRDAEREAVPRERWHFVPAEAGPDAGRLTRISLEGGFEPGRVYELVYQAADPRPVGLGLAVIRDVMSHSRYDLDSPFPTSRGIGFGFSQSGRFLRQFLYQGFNVDEGGRKVFDGVFIHGAGAGRGGFNERFAQPGRTGPGVAFSFDPHDLYPFTSLPAEDPATGLREGLLDALPQGMQPRLMVTNAGSDYWRSAASLIHTTPDGFGDVDPAPNERVYHLAGAYHPSGPSPRPEVDGLKDGAGFAGDVVDSRATLRALAMALVGWVGGGESPPDSRIPSVARGTLVQPLGLAFPPIPEVAVPTSAHQAYRADFGPRFRSDGIVDLEPPRLGIAFTSLVPQVDGLGNELGGVRGIELRVPVATFAPWRVRTGPPGTTMEILEGGGTFFPLSLTDHAGDGRPSLQLLYGSREAYRLRLEAAAQGLVGEGYLLEEDLGWAVERGLALWDRVVGEGGG